MQIETNKNIDQYKDDFFKGLTLQQTVAAVAVLVSGGGSFAIFYIILGLPMSICIYFALPFALPAALAGFLRIRGMSPFVYYQKKRKVQRQSKFVSRPAYVKLAGVYNPEMQYRKSENKTGKVILQTEDDLFLRGKAYDTLLTVSDKNSGN